MGRIVEEICSTQVSALLDLTKISNCPVEMSYITKMRNLILFQVSSSAEFKYLDGRFYHKFGYTIEVFQYSACVTPTHSSKL
ncbi:hypothetical protein TNIN_217801 [Trichonephila inaurata madagascariensis]|uniref:Uncharacterized protein n=1 Tax=Trichonephila inaurata madagascariensis TaxID=2747483 RepID=A0A8X6YVY6_9ARAC|nr:hypothetical protein TNIN_217801 [Trichonephila inaurata madagascariensis]